MKITNFKLIKNKMDILNFIDTQEKNIDSFFKGRDARLSIEKSYDGVHCCNLPNEILLELQCITTKINSFYTKEKEKLIKEIEEIE